ncbi:unnamed protein product [Symbiodinium natans]|uniref:Uncharacterized protein n=1 Tax=Symbiodinium natans TaxID=878477 RepID=A0A812KIG1_9DINO|nr:unnamed protein product [Symbiodinium natans]
MRQTQRLKNFHCAEDRATFSPFTDLGQFGPIRLWPAIPSKLLLVARLQRSAALSPLDSRHASRFNPSSLYDVSPQLGAKVSKYGPHTQAVLQLLCVKSGPSDA